MNIKKNITKGTLSNTIGIVIILASIASVFIPKLGIDWTGASVGILTGAGIAALIRK